MQIECKENFEIKKMTTFKIGGVVTKVYLPKNQQEFVTLLNTLDNYIVLGNCSNILFATNGYKGNIILTTQIKGFQIRGTKIYTYCGVKGPLLSQKACEAGLSGFEFMIGFPGTIGGEIFMNASAHGQSISDTLVSCCLYNKKSKDIIYKQKSEMNFGYRQSILQNNEYVLLSAEFELKKSSKEDIQNLMARNLQTRRNVQPSLVYPNAGSIFKNPSNDSAGRLLDKAGVKSFDLENTKVWANHANFIINKGNATSEDILELMLKMKKTVQETYTIELIPEIIFIGDKTKKEEELCKMLYQKTQE